eukprot:CAMPEP_0171482292 /NCGR_PEP_ID=MMETSP0946-20130122/7374_1 /TAXON_ID=109269 /ORGANISM="Vaucheria litorea, Strain CCMP2940" /LENGTH=113 /DNA_ID=CAMNT_0012014267 /DNA_START=54 /DNA_END=395 /DNA_ORIENTATION=+
MSFKSDEIMSQLKSRIGTEGKQYVEKVGGTYLFVVTKDGQEKNWFLNLKDGNGSLSEGAANADCTITTDDESLFALFTGKADPQNLFFGGKLKLDGDMGLAMSLSAITEGAKL